MHRKIEREGQEKQGATIRRVRREGGATDYVAYMISHSLFSLFTSSLRFLSIQELLSLRYSLCFSCLLCEIDIAHVLDVDGRRVKVVDEIRQPLLQWSVRAILTAVLLSGLKGSGKLYR